MLKNSEIEKIPQLLKEVVSSAHGNFFSSFLTAYGLPKSSIKRAVDSMESSGQRKCSIKQKLLYRECSKGSDIESEYLTLLEEVNKERFAFVTDFERIMAKDMMSGKGIDISFEDLTVPLRRQLGEDFFFYDLKVYYLCPECRAASEEKDNISGR